MKPVNKIIDNIRQVVRGGVRQIARWLNHVTRGRLHPNTVTIVGVVMHVPIALLIALGFYLQAALLLVVFGLFDALDGELARLQKRTSQQGMLLDATTDRMKEVLLYTGAAYALAMGNMPELAAVAVIACGASLCVSYVKAKGEAAIASKKAIPHDELNRLFGDGLARFEIRMAILVVGLLAHQLMPAIALIAVLATYTAIWRLILISKRVGNAAD